MKHWPYIALIFALLAFGYWYTGHADQAGYNRAKGEYEEKDRKRLEQEKKAEEERRRLNNQLSGDLAKAQDDIRERDKRISNLERKYETLAQRGNDCNLTIGTVLLHNSALGYEFDSRQLDEEGRALSTVTGSAFIEHCRGLATQFELQRQQLNRLIEAKR